MKNKFLPIITKGVMLYLSYDFPNLRALVTPVIKIRRGSLKVVPNAHVKKISSY